MYHGNEEVKSYKIVANYKTLTADDVQYSILLDNFDDIETYLKLEPYLPEASQYISIEIHFKTEEE